MPKALGIGLALLLGLSALFVGCGGEEGGTPAGKEGGAKAKAAAPTPERTVVPIGEGGTAVAAKTPMEAWLNLNEASHTGDKALALSSFLAPEEFKEAVALGTMSIAAMFILRQELAAAYGEEALEGLFKGVKTEPFDRKDLEARTKIEEEGDKATAHLAGGHVVGLVKKGGAWFVDRTKEEFPPPDELKEMMRFDTARVFSVNYIRPKIGTKGYPKVEDILKLMVTAHDARMGEAK
ncbi:MAG TPA: hypothetical protein VNE39_04130 [Planctomycetota bacterium]|nr:hypothetical protein [Planctomycetota bacterium]